MTLINQTLEALRKVESFMSQYCAYPSVEFIPSNEFNRFTGDYVGRLVIELPIGEKELCTFANKLQKETSHD